MSVPDANINSIAFKLRGNREESSGSGEREKIVRANIEKRIETEEKNLSRANIPLQNAQKSYKTDELPPELAEIFADLKNSMLTKSKE